jgi:Icc-related predicted phosphoesterase
MSATIVRIAAMADMHTTRTGQGTLQPMLARIAEMADVLLLAGDLTDYGLPEEARVLARELATVRIPTAAVLGNHDFESGKHDEIAQILADTGVSVLDGDACELHGVGIAGVKGFGGGFGQRALGPWGEGIIKQFVHEAVNEALKLEAALARLRTSPMVPPEIYPFVGSSRLEEPISRYPVSLVVHGHAHRGQLEGRTKSGVPVYNISMPLLARAWPERFPFRVFEVQVAQERAPAPTAPATDAAPPTLVAPGPHGRRATDAVVS